MNKPIVRKVYLKILAILACPFFLSGCMDADCKIPDYHVHKYIGKIRRGYKCYDENHTIINYFNSEYLTPGYEKWVEEERDWPMHYPTTIEYNWQEETIKITKDELEFYKVKDELFRGDENWDYLFSVMQRCTDYLHFRYKYTDGDSDYYDWTTDKNHSGNTGEVRVRHFKFYGYRIVKKDGKYVREQSPLVDDIRDIIDEYPFFSQECYKTVYKEYKFNKNEVGKIKLEDIDEFRQPDRENKELKKNNTK